MYYLDHRPAESLSNHEESTNSVSNFIFPSTDELSLDLYVGYLSAMHFKNNQGFKKEYIVSSQSFQIFIIFLYFLICCCNRVECFR